MILFSLPVASVALGISIAAIVPTLRDTYGASNLQVGAVMGIEAPRNRNRHRPCRRATRAISSGMALLAIGWGGFGIAPDLLVAAPLAMIGGMGNGVVIVRFRTMMQRNTPPHERASTIGFAYAVTFSMIVAGMVVVVPLSDLLGQRAAFTTAGTIFALGGSVAALCWPSAVPEAARHEALAEASPVTAR